MSRYSPGEVISGKYRIVRLIGDGGMGVVYEARHEVLGSSVALKFLHSDLARRAGLTERFLREARVSASIHSPHVTRVTDVDTAQDGAPYLVMELLTGQSLQTVLDHQGRLAKDQAVDFGLQILSGLEAAHAIGVVHRDLKPDNVFVTPSGGGPLLKLIDFGIAKLRASSEYTKGLTRAGVVMGTPEYMAPEQLVSAHTADHRADLYSFGVMLFEMFSGLRPADGDDADVIIAAVQAGHVRRLGELVPELPEGLVHLIERAMAPERDARFGSASEMRLSLAAYAGELSHAGRLAATAEPLPVGPMPASSGLSSFPAPASAAVPRTVSSNDGAPRSASQLGAARTSLSERAPALHEPPRGTVPRGTEMGGDNPFQAAEAPRLSYPVPRESPPRPKRRRSGLIVVLLSTVVLAGGGAVGYAAYRAADHERDRTPPLPDLSAAPAVTGPLRLDPVTPDVSTSTPQPPRVTTPDRAPRPGPGPGQGPGASTPTTPSASGTPPFPLPFPLPSAIQLPTALPSSIQLPPGFPTGLPPAFPGAPQPTATTPPTATPTATPTAAPTATGRRPRSTKPTAP